MRSLCAPQKKKEVLVKMMAREEIPSSRTTSTANSTSDSRDRPRSNPWIVMDWSFTALQGGLTLWVELDERVDGLKVYQEARKHKISIFPGIICSSTDQYRNFIRISCGYTWNEKIEAGIVTLAKIIEKML